MIRAQSTSAVVEQAAANPPSRARGRITALIVRLTPPLADPRFWATQFFVLAIALTHDTMERGGALPHLGMAYFLPISAFFIPVVYSALYFGLAGALATAGWCTVISLPNFIFWHHGSARYGVVTQMLIIDVVAIFVGSRVDQREKARHEAEAASRALRASEEKYRGLFETAGEAILVLDVAGKVVECNAASEALLGQPRHRIQHSSLDEVVPAASAAGLTRAIRGDGASGSPDVRLDTVDGRTAWVQPVCTPFADDAGYTQVVLRDVTAQKLRETGLQTYAAQILQAQEEERRRIAQELHDDTIQSLAVLCRELDAAHNESLADSGALRMRLREMHAYAESIVSSVRTFARGLRPPILDDLGLTPAIERLLSDLTTQTSIGGRLLVRGADRRLSLDAELALFRIAQEALRNVAWHSEASHVDVRLNYLHGETRLIVADNGTGFTAPRRLEDLAGAKSMGLLGMHERARILGGSLEVRSAPSRGTRIIARLPA